MQAFFPLRNESNGQIKFKSANYMHVLTDLSRMQMPFPEGSYMLKKTRVQCKRYEWRNIGILVAYSTILDSY